MTVISATGLSKSYVGESIFSGVAFSVEKGDRIALIGANGAGKSTLFNILFGDEPYDEGSIYISNDLKIGYFKQNDLFTSEKTVYEEMLAIFDNVISTEHRLEELSHIISEESEKGETDTLNRLLSEYDRLSEQFRNLDGYTYKSEIEGVLNSMAFPASFYDKKTSSLSGGERTRLALASLLLKKPDILMLDEPTNHLDIGTLKWLEQYIRTYRGTVLIISHDRYFIDNTVTRIFEMEGGRLSVYEGNYTFYAKEKKARYLSELKAYEHQNKEIARQEEMIRRYRERGTEKLAKRAGSREKALEKIERISKPVNYKEKIKITFHEETKSGNDVIEAVGLGKTVSGESESRRLFSNVEFDIKRGERICLIGPNGTGKTTLLKILTGQSSPTEGYIKIGHNVDFGYYDQEQSMLNENSTVIEEMRDSYALYSDNELRGLLARFLFRGEDVFKSVASLSGGERARLALLKLMMSGANVLLLDEPTNHLDIMSKEVFEDAIIEFPGTSIIVSHDRYLLNKVPTSIYELSRSGITVYSGKYDYYNEKKAAITSTAAYMGTLGKSASSASNANDASSDKQQRIKDRRRTKELQAEKRRKERRIEFLENRIAELEADIEKLRNSMYDEKIMSDHTRLAEISEKIAERQQELDSSYDEWTSCSEDI